MTTVVFDGDTIASDSRGICDYIDDGTKKLFKVNGHFIGVAGNLSAAYLFISWYRNQTKPKPELRNNNDDFYALVIIVTNYSDLASPAEGNTSP